MHRSSEIGMNCFDLDFSLAGGIIHHGTWRSPARFTLRVTIGCFPKLQPENNLFDARQERLGSRPSQETHDFVSAMLKFGFLGQLNPKI